MDALNSCLHAHHHFTTPYCPQSNSTVETVCKEVLRVCRALLSEFRLKESEWPTVLPLVQSILNHSRRSGLGNRAPITVFTGLPADNPLQTLLPSSSTAPASIDVIKAKRIMKADSLIKALDEIHRDTRLRRTKTREVAVTRHNEKTHVQPVNFGVGDYVLVGQRTGKHGHKLLVTWRGPQRITRVMSNFVFECQDLISSSFSLLHANRLKFYSDAELNVTEVFLDTVAHNSCYLNKVEKLLDLRFKSDKNQYEVRAKWLGFDHEEPTWEPFDAMMEDIPALLSDYLASHPDQDLVSAAKASVGQ